jgi:methylmalonyl-CoA carboxyltransferase 1.3S subunit
LKLKISVEGKSYEVDIEVLEDDQTTPPPGYLPPHPAATTTVQSVASPSAPAAPAEGNVDEAKVCRSPVAGVVVKVNVQAGQKLQPNDLMIVLEAMKMETYVTAPTAGTVKTIKVQAGDGVKVNQILVEFE